MPSAFDELDLSCRPAVGVQAASEVQFQPIEHLEATTPEIRNHFEPTR